MAATKTKSKPKTEVTMQQEILDAAELLAMPIDLDQLTADGTLRKAGNGWYEVLDAARLPEHALRKIKAVKSANRVKFRKASKKLAKFLESTCALQSQAS
jgi:hypothetical protein